MSFRKLFLDGRAGARNHRRSRPAKASADWLFTPFIGGTFGGSANVIDFDLGEDFENEFNQKLTYGASLAYLGAGIVGFEMDFGYSPNFFEHRRGRLDQPGRRRQCHDADGQRDARLLRLARCGPYASFGGGLVKTRVDSVDQFFEDVDRTASGSMPAAGIMAIFSDNVGMRGDIRYFRSLTERRRRRHRPESWRNSGSGAERLA